MFLESNGQCPCFQRVMQTGCVTPLPPPKPLPFWGAFTRWLSRAGDSSSHSGQVCFAVIILECEQGLQAPSYHCVTPESSVCRAGRVWHSHRAWMASAGGPERLLGLSGQCRARKACKGRTAGGINPNNSGQAPGSPSTAGTRTLRSFPCCCRALSSPFFGRVTHPSPSSVSPSHLPQAEEQVLVPLLLQQHPP